MLPRYADEDKAKKEQSYSLRQLGLLRRRLLSLRKRVLLLLVVATAGVLAGAGYAIPRAIREHFVLSAAYQAYQELGMPADTIPVLIPVYSRPAYLQTVLQSLRVANHIEKVRKARRGLDNGDGIGQLRAHDTTRTNPAICVHVLQTVLIFSQDGSFPEITRLIESVNFTHVIHLRHNPPYWGLPSMLLRTDAPTASNVFFLLRFAMDWLRCPAAIVLESDIMLAPDGLDYFRWAHGQVVSDPELQERVFTINGYYELSRPDHDPYQFTTEEYGFMVWGWLCPGFSWPLIRSGWTWFGNWDITLEESVRKPSGKVSLSPVVSRTRNIGMQGINFDIRDPSEVKKWTSLYLPPAPIDFRDKRLRILPGRPNMPATAATPPDPQ